MKALIGKQKNLPQALKAQIQAAPGKMMSKSPLKKDDLKMMDTTGDAIGGDGKALKTITTKDGQGPKSTPKGNAASNKGKVAYGGTKTWKEGSKSAKSSTGMNLNQLVAKRGKTEKGSNEYNAIQNQINKSLGSKKTHSVKGTAKVGGTTIKEKPSGKTIVKNQTDDGNTKVITKPNGTVKSKEITGKSTDTKADDAKVKSTTKADGSNRTVTVTNENRNVKKTDASGEVTKDKTRKRIGKGRIKGAIKKGKEAVFGKKESASPAKQTKSVIKAKPVMKDKLKKANPPKPPKPPKKKATPPTKAEAMKKAAPFKNYKKGYYGK